MFKRLKFYLTLDRIGPDMLLTHWILYIKSLTHFLYKSRFNYLDESADIRPGSYFLNVNTISIGKNVVIRPLSYIAGDPPERSKGKPSIIIEDNVLLADGLRIYPSNHKFADTKKPIALQGDTNTRPVVIKSGSWIGANVIILPGVTIGRNSVVGAGSVVTKNIPDFVVAAGKPGKGIKKIKAQATRHGKNT